MISLRDAIDFGGCAQLPTDDTRRLRHDLFAHRGADLEPEYLTYGDPDVFSVRRFLDGVLGPHIRLNFALVGWERLGPYGSGQRRTIIRSLVTARRLLNAVGIGIGQVSWHSFSEHDVPKHMHLDSRVEAAVLYSKWDGPAGGIDVYWVQSITGLGGERLDGIAWRSAAVQVSANNGTLAHEIGHVLGLGHTEDPGLTMTQGAQGDGRFTQNQGAMMRDCPLVRAGWEVPDHPSAY